MLKTHEAFDKAIKSFHNVLCVHARGHIMDGKIKILSFFVIELIHASYISALCSFTLLAAVDGQQWEMTCREMPVGRWDVL